MDFDLFLFKQRTFLELLQLDRTWNCYSRNFHIPDALI